MAELQFELALYPSPVLRRVAKSFEAFDEDLQDVVRGMFALMYKSQGVGLAGPQVGLQKRVMVLNASGEEGDALAMINPTILSREGEATIFEEGCLSFPDIYAEVERPDGCTVEFWSPEGERQKRAFTGFQSRVVQHEYDHLEGVLLSDRMSRADKLRHKRALRDLVDDYRRNLAASK